jgi:hypothetical protein
MSLFQYLLGDTDSAPVGRLLADDDNTAAIQAGRAAETAYAQSQSAAENALYEATKAGRDAENAVIAHELAERSKAQLAQQNTTNVVVVGAMALGAVALLRGGKRRRRRR